MCGIAGQWGGVEAPQSRAEQTSRALAMLRHRGPDQFGIYADESVALGSARLSIVDLGNGQQPIANEDESLWIVFNGEVFNHVELRPELEARGHRFRTRSDTEVILHLYEELGPDCLNRLNGQFAIAIWDRRRGVLFLGRDRLGVRPLFYAERAGRVVFGSEIKALLAHPAVRADVDPQAWEQVFTYWSPLSPRTAFRDIQELPPGHYLLADARGLTVRRYWEIRFPEDSSGARRGAGRELSEAVEQFRDLLVDAARLRLRADVEVGAYLSGGLDSSAITSIIRNHTSTKLRTFSIAFTDVAFDESAFQEQMARFLGTEHQVVRATHADIGRVFPEVIWHTEVPILRTSPAPMFLLSKLVRDQGLKVVLTGEGADEFLAGYDIFKEAQIRRFWARQPGSRWRPSLLRRLYPEIAGLGQSSSPFLAAFFKNGLQDIQAPDYSHAIRWRNTRRTARFFSAELQEQQRVAAGAARASVKYPAAFASWGPLERAQFLEIEVFLSQYLLSSQGDRMGMAHSVEGRFPFLDYRVVEFCCGLPSRWKMRGLTEKSLLRQAMADLLPAEIRQRRKRPYRAPIHRSFFHEAEPGYLAELLDPAQVRAAGLFDAQAVTQLVHKVRQHGPIGETDDMAIAGIISGQLWHRHFVADFKPRPGLGAGDDVKWRVLSAGTAELRS